MNRIGTRTAAGLAIGRSTFDDAGRHPRGHLVLGDPQRVIDKILAENEYFRMDRFAMQFNVAGIDHRHMLKAIELYGTVVAPAVRKGCR